jgi:hypothetical protein
MLLTAAVLPVAFVPTTNDDCTLPD